MKIAIVCDVLGDANNGTSIAAYNLIDYMMRQGHEVHIVCPDADKRGRAGFYVVPTVNFGMFNNYVKQNGVVISKRDDVILMRAIKGCDVVHIMMPLGLGLRTAHICYKFNVPCTAGFHVQPENITNHFFIGNVRWINRKVYYFFYRHLYKYLDGIHYPSQFIKNKFEDTIGIKTPGFVISNGISKDFRPGKVEKPDYLKDKILILFTGRFSKEKSHPILIKAITYSKYKNKIQLIFAGKGPQEKALKKYALREKLPNQPIFQFFSHDQIVKTINMCDLYCHPANIDIEPISCMEAIAGGLVPIVTDSDRCGTKQFAIDDKNIFKANDSKDLAKKIDYWLDHPTELEKRKHEYANFMKSLEREHCMHLMEEMFKKVIANHKESRCQELKIKK